jgi:hypothetical protein
MTRQQILQPLALSMAVLCSLPALAKPAFSSSEIVGQGSEIIFCDLDGDELDDAVLIGRTNLSVFFQDSKQGFTRSPQLQFHLDDQPMVVWPAKLGRKAASLLMMTSDGVTELYFTNRTDPPARRQIIKQQTIIPDKLDEPDVMSFPMSADTGTDWPLLLVPVAGGLQVWQNGRPAGLPCPSAAACRSGSIATPGNRRSSSKTPWRPMSSHRWPVPAIPGRLD